jgi:hypothetical protein
MPTRREVYLTRGIRGHCPRCNGTSVFKSRYRLHDHCPDCGLPLEHEDGWSLGAIPLNYTLTCVFWVLPVGVVFLFGLVVAEGRAGPCRAGCAGAALSDLPVLKAAVDRHLLRGPAARGGRFHRKAGTRVKKKERPDNPYAPLDF